MGLDNAFTSTLTIAPTLNASLTGAGPTGFDVPADTPFGCTDFRTYNLDLINDFAPYCESDYFQCSHGKKTGRRENINVEVRPRVECCIVGDVFEDIG